MKCASQSWATGAVQTSDVAMFEKGQMKAAQCGKRGSNRACSEV